MASSSSYSEDLTCPICLNIFSDPVFLLCGHSFCRECITVSLSSRRQCPQCRTTFDETHFTTSHILKSLAEKAKEPEKLKTDGGTDKEVPAWFCPEHEEKLKLFCVTDQQLACIICRDSEKHEGHKFIPVKEAAASLRKEVEMLKQRGSAENLPVKILARTQKGEIRKTRQKSWELMKQISSQFEEMHQFLKRKEEEIQKELKQKENNEVQKMTQSLNVMETVLKEGREWDEKVRSVLKITEPEKFLHSWTHGGRSSAKDRSKPGGKPPQVVRSSLSMGHYESHLQVFMWKEMLQVIEPRAEQMKLRSQGEALTVTSDGRSVVSACQKCLVEEKIFNILNVLQRTYTSVLSTNKFTSGEHYWEIDVGRKGYWELGLRNYFLKYDGRTYSVSDQGQCGQKRLEGSPIKIGVYLNCSSKELSFYNADNMKHIHSLTVRRFVSESAYLNIGNYDDNVPVSVCWYSTTVDGSKKLRLNIDCCSSLDIYPPQPQLGRDIPAQNR
ncbi:zinc-binding protein A33-like [Cololabis saira]|uniref:zinc-binding protein A33-like n=1 Tax=Cololabis saira TaxID=129043 RepID=UPI002AD512F8|nr:zinc-binding protein A33-like [Cololabis saira]